MAIPAVTRKYTPGSCRNSRNHMRHPPRWEMRLDSLHCMQSNPVFPIKHVRSPDFLDGTPERPRNNVTKRDEHSCNSGMHNSSVYTKSTRDEAHFPFIGSIAILCSTEYSTCGLNSLRKLQRFSETPASSLYEYSFQHSSVKNVPCTTYRLKMRADSLSMTEEVSQFSTSTSSGDFPQQ